MKATDTGFGLPVSRAMGMLYPEERRLYHDPISERFLTGKDKFLIKLMRLPLALNGLMAFYEGLYPGMKIQDKVGLDVIELERLVLAEVA